MYNGNYPDNFDENQDQGNGAGGREAGNGSALTEDAAQRAQESANAQGAGQDQRVCGGNGPQDNGGYQNRQDGFQPRNYYDQRYRGGESGWQGQNNQNAGNGGFQNRANGDSGSGAYGYRDRQDGDRSGYGYHSGAGNGGANGKKPGKKRSGVKIAAAVLLVIAFVGFCGGISWLAVSSLQDQFVDAAADEEAVGQEEPVFEEAEPQEPAVQASGSGQIASAGTVRESGTVTAVVTDVTDVVERVMPACVSITNSYTEQFQDFWGQSYSRDEEASGSGIIIGENETELLVVSNNHVVDGANTLLVQFIDGSVAEAQVKGVDSTVDLAVIAVKLEDIEEETKKAICIAQMGDSDSLKIGEPAIAIGNALGYGQSVTTGVISALNRTLEVSETGTSNALIQTDAAINPGNSGGALLNINGEVVGINSNKIGGSIVEGMGYAIPISTAKPIIEELVTHETRLKVADEEKGYLGISCINVTSEITENFSMPEGIFVAQVYEGTGAARAGLVRGDIITAVEGTTVRNQEELTKQLGYYKAGETVEITIMQGSPNGFQAKNVQVTLSPYEEVNEGSKRSQEEQSGSRQWRLP